jgi:two-component system, OmpR family, response regulator
MRFLVVEDQPKVARVIKRGLEEEAYAVDVAGCGEDAIALAMTTPYDLIVLDLMLPDMDGFAVCAKIRQRSTRIPIMMLTAKGEVDDRIMGLNLGADDYVTKPFAFPELLARVRALLRRNGSDLTPELAVDDLRMDTAERTVTRCGYPIELTNKEHAVLELLMRREGAVVSRDEIFESVWSYDSDPESNVVEVYISNLRRKIDDPFPVKLLFTVRGAGYRLRSPSIS